MAIPTHSPCIKGDPGDSAYQVAVINGYSGKESEWLLSLKGEPGSLTSQQIADIVSQVDITGKVDKVEGSSLVPDAEIIKLQGITSGGLTQSQILTRQL
jgi:hypothetical protein